MWLRLRIQRTHSDDGYWHWGLFSVDQQATSLAEDTINEFRRRNEWPPRANDDSKNFLKNAVISSVVVSYLAAISAILIWLALYVFNPSHIGNHKANHDDLEIWVTLGTIVAIVLMGLVAMLLGDLVTNQLAAHSSADCWELSQSLSTDDPFSDWDQPA